jgi:hypothetical protein
VRCCGIEIAAGGEPFRIRPKFIAVRLEFSGAAFFAFFVSAKGAEVICGR